MCWERGGGKESFVKEEGGAYPEEPCLELVQPLHRHATPEAQHAAEQEARQAQHHGQEAAVGGTECTACLHGQQGVPQISTDGGVVVVGTSGSVGLHSLVVLADLPRELEVESRMEQAMIQYEQPAASTASTACRLACEA